MTDGSITVALNVEPFTRAVQEACDAMVALVGIVKAWSRDAFRKKRPGQWTDRTRAKRARRLARAQERREGLSRRDMKALRRYIRETHRIHADTKRALIETDAQLLAQTINADLRERFGTDAPTFAYEDPR